MKQLVIDAAGGLLALLGLALLLAETPEAGLAVFAAVKICGLALLYGSYRLLDRVHPEWGEEDV